MEYVGHGSRTHTDGLRVKIQRSLVTSISERRFLPIDQLHDIFTLPAIKDAVKELSCGHDDRINLASTIHDHGRAVFAMLVHIQQENMIIEFRKRRILDSQFPLDEARAEEILGPITGPSLVSEVQWKFLPFVFPERMWECPHYIPDRQILPFVSCDQIAFGAFGVVDKIGISTSQQNFVDQRAAELHVIRKRLKATGRQGEFEREDKCLRLLNGLRHPNIINFLGSYTHKNKHCFLFPPIETDLGKLLTSERRHGDFQWDFVFYSALTGLASALAKTHRLVLKEDEHGIQLEAIGYHHDLRPPNVLVSNDTFILADFGLGSLKDAEALSHTPYKIIGGDYIAPECTDMEEIPQTVNRAIDVWAFGCLILEVVTYMLKGVDGINRFRKMRLTPSRMPRSKDSGFYQPQPGGGIKQEVLDWIEELKRDSITTQTDVCLLKLSLDALHANPSKRPTMDEVYRRLAGASMLKHFESVQDIFQRIHGEPQRVSPASHEDHHLKCLGLAQGRFEAWGRALALREIGILHHDSIIPENLVEVMASLFHILSQEPGQRVSGDPSSLRSFQDNLDLGVTKLWELLPSGLVGIAINYLQHKNSDNTPHEQILNTLPDQIHSGDTTASCDALLRDLENVVDSFADELPDLFSLEELRNAKSMEDVYDITDDLQRGQELRNLQRMGTSLQRMHGYTEMMENNIIGSTQYVSLVWGPLGYLLRRSSTFDKAYTSVIDATVKLGEALPDFRAPQPFLKSNPQSKEILLLLFKDILGFYGVILKPFSHPSWISKFTSLWPRVWALISEISTHISRLTLLMRTEISVESIHQEYEFRKTALETFRKQSRDNHRQEFNRIKTSLRPREYDEALYELRGVRSPGTGNWLFSHKAYTEWFKDSKSESRVLWLRGIPGAGKSVLCGTVIDHLKSKQNLTCFAFLTYKDEKISALSVIHSLIFQLAESDYELMDIVCQSDLNDLKSNLATATDLLKSMILHAGPVCVVIDGLDEIGEGERVRMVGQLLELVKSRTGLEVILSSRPEADLVHAMEKATVVIQVHDHNEQSIEYYVMESTEKMFIDRQILRVDHQKKIRTLLVPVAKRARGMFLYARIVMKMVYNMNDMSEILNELEILPENLDDAYRRIILRLEKHETKMQVDKAKRLLGWIACSSMPLTIEEAEQALAVKSQHPRQTYDSFAKLEPVKLLGPIVETAGGYIRFVHFTAKEYVSSPHLGISTVDVTLATLDLATRCIEYLCQYHHDPCLSSPEISEKLLNGQYVFDAFASRMWFELSCQCLRSVDGFSPPAALIESLYRLRECRSAQSLHEGNDHIIDKEDPRDVQHSNDNEVEVDDDLVIEGLKQQHGLLHQLLRRVSQFRRASFSYTGEASQDRSDDEHDPLSTLVTSNRIRQVIDNELCDEPGINCQSKHRGVSNPQGVHKKCAQILNFYGERPFKCQYPRCEFWRHGFETRTRRKHHKLAHEAPLKCHVAGCKFERVGFLSENMRERHLQHGHSSDLPQATFDVWDLSNVSVESLLRHLVTEDQVEHVEKILSNLPDPDHYRNQDLRMLASLAASPAMLRLFWNNPPEKDWIQCTKQSIKGRNLRTLEANLTTLSRLIQKSSRPVDNYLGVEDIVRQLVSKNWVEGMKMWSKSAKQKLETESGSDSDGPGLHAVYAKDFLGQASLLKEAAKHPFEEQTLDILWNDTGLLSYLPSQSDWASRTLRNVARFGCSVTLAQELLRMGARINFQPTKRDRSSLHWAATHNSAAGAKMMELLLFRGADPHATQYVGGCHKMIRDEEGAKNVQIWLEKCWDDLVKDTEHIRSGKEVSRPVIPGSYEKELEK